MAPERQSKKSRNLECTVRYILTLCKNIAIKGKVLPKKYTKLTV